MQNEPNFNKWAANIDKQLKAYYAKQKQESKKRFKQYYK